MIGDAIGDAKSVGDLRRDFGTGLSQAAVRYLAEREWAKSAEDVLWRTSKLGLRLPAEAERKIQAVLVEMSALTC